MLTFEQSLFQYFPWCVLSIFILCCDFKCTANPIVSKLWLNSSNVICILFLAIYFVLHIAVFFPEWESNKLRSLKSGYLLTSLLLGYLRNSLKDKKLINSETNKNK